MTDPRRRQLRIRREVSEEALTAGDLRIAEDLLAKLVARAYAADHPELFAPTQISQKGGDAARDGRDLAPPVCQKPR